MQAILAVWVDSRFLMVSVYARAEASVEVSAVWVSTTLAAMRIVEWIDQQ